jgi:twitching motility protein PilT
MISTGRVRELIDDQEKTVHLRDTIAKGYTTYGMQTFDQALMDLVKRKVISYDEALRQSSNPDDFKLKFSGIDSTSDGAWGDFERAKDQEEQEEQKEGIDDEGQVKIERF